MTPEQAHTVTQWIVAEGLNGTAETDLLDGFCERLLAFDVPLIRVNIAQPTLHPITGGHLFIWQLGEAAQEESWERNVIAASEAYAQTPVARMLALLPTTVPVAVGPPSSSHVAESPFAAENGPCPPSKHARRES